jgi:hypothetical protein
MPENQKPTEPMDTAQADGGATADTKTEKPKRKRRPRRLFKRPEDFDPVKADRAMMVEAVELARDPNAKPHERAAALRAYATLRDKLTGDSATPPAGAHDGRSALALVQEIRKAGGPHEGRAAS